MTVKIKPEDEQLIAEKLRSGAFQSVEELIHLALVAMPSPEVAVQNSHKHLADVLSELPFAGSGLNLERQKSYPRPIEL